MARQSPRITINAASSELEPVALAATAKEAGLRYVSDVLPGIRRIKRGKDFAYLDPQGRKIRDRETLQRIRSLVIPPAWTRVWICPLANGHLQVTGRDARGRKQYRYHPRWREVRDEAKYGKLVAFGAVLPRIRSRVKADLSLPGLPRRKVLAVVARLLEATLIRVGNEEYARTNGSFGLTTLRNRHVRIKKGIVHFTFNGKSGVKHEIDVQDPHLVRIVRRCQDLPGQDLFQYVDENGNRHAVGSADVNDYLREITGADFTAKDFRTWAGTVLAVRALVELAAFASEAEAKRNIVRAIESVAKRLGNTKAVCRRCYVHPAVLNAYLDRSLLESAINKQVPAKRSRRRGLTHEESAVLAFLNHRLRSTTALAS
jgi:DNA topoisomerase-1